MTYIDQLLSPTGRISRTQWWMFFVGVYCPFLLFCLGLLGFQWVVVVAPGAWVLMAGVNARRLHDMGDGFSGWWQVMIQPFTGVLGLAALDGMMTRIHAMPAILAPEHVAFWVVAALVGVSPNAVYGIIPGGKGSNVFGPPPV